MIENKCDCEYHECANQDDYTEDGNTCEECFTDCVIMDEIETGENK